MRRKLFRKIILLNELGGKEHLAYRFSDPDGEHTGKSGWSFGVCQFDIANNNIAILCLKECGFSDVEISLLKKQQIPDMTGMNNRLLANKQIIDKWDTRQIDDCLSRVGSMAKLAPFSFLDEKAFLMAADYHNQFYISKGGQFFTWAKRFIAPISDYDILKYKLNQTWGLKRPDDVKRRYANILKVMQEGV